MSPEPRLPTSREIDLVWHTLRAAGSPYPGFPSWFWGKVVDDLEFGRRRLFLREADGRLQGVLIAKRAPEAKICTLWVAPDARGRGLARELLAEALAWLGTDTPLMSIPQGLMEDCRGLVRQFDFRLDQVLRDHYRPGSSEFVFNGLLPERAARPPAQALPLDPVLDLAPAQAQEGLAP